MPSPDAPAALLTRILKEWSGGDQQALERLTPFVYAELHRIAAIKMSTEQRGHQQGHDHLTRDRIRVSEATVAVHVQVFLGLSRFTRTRVIAGANRT